MARSDLLLSLVKAGSAGDRQLFRKTVEAIIAEERAKNHGVLADRLAQQLSTNGVPSPNGAMSGASSTGDLCFEVTPKRRLEELILPQHVRQACSELIEEQQRSDLLRSHNIPPRHRVLLTGAPGNGKTTLAEALAESLMVPLVIARYDGLVASYLGETATRLRKLFEYARSRQCVLFFDEFDTLGKERGDKQETGEIKRVVSSLLMQIDDLPAHTVVVTATNHSELLDRAVWRRFQLRVELPRPKQAEVERFFIVATERFGFPLGMQPKTLAKRLVGLSFAELEDFVGDVARRYVLSLPEADVRQIVNARLKQWEHRIGPVKSSSSTPASTRRQTRK